MSASIQLRTPAAQAAALAQAAPLVREAAAEGAQLIATPEGPTSCSATSAALFEAIAPAEDDAGGRSACARWPDELGVWLLIGSALVRRDGRQVRQPLDPGAARRGDRGHLRQAAHVRRRPAHRRAHPRSRPATRPATGRWSPRPPARKLGLTICYDLRFPALHRALAKAGAEVLTVPSAFTRPTGAAHWEVLLRARAIETGAFVIAPAQGGTHEDGRATWGHSMAVGALGRGDRAGRPRRALRPHGRPRPGRGRQGPRRDPGAEQRAGVRRPMIRYALVCDHDHEFEGWFARLGRF